MSIATPPAPSPPTRPKEGEQRFLLTRVSWGLYEHLLREIGERPIRVTYDRGRLELMAPTLRHGRFGRVLGRFIEIAAEEADIDYLCAGITTFRREDLDRGLEPDDSFYFCHVEQIIGKKEIDLSVDPPPDLAVEVDVTRSSIDRLAIYAALGVSEVWRFDGHLLVIHGLVEGTYRNEESSRFLPFLPIRNVRDFLQRSLTTSDKPLNREFRAWVRSLLPPDDSTK